MSIKLRFEKGSLITQVTLKDEALTPLLDIVSKHQSDEPAATTPPEKEREKLFSDLDDPSKAGERIDFVRSWLKNHSAAEALTQIGWPNFPEKILILGAQIEAKANTATAIVSWRLADIESAFESARLAAPANFARDISVAIRAGIIATVTPRTYNVSRTGWLKLYDGIIHATVAKFADSE